MFTFLVVLHSILLVALVLVTALRPPRVVHRQSELERRAKRSVAAKKELERLTLEPDIRTLLRLKQALLLVIVVLLSVVTYGWVIGVIVALGVVLFYPAVSRIPAFYRLADTLYGKLEPTIIRFVAWAQPVFHFLRDMQLPPIATVIRADSREEFAEMVANSTDVLSSDERRLITASLDFKDKQVKTIMTPRAAIDSIESSEFLGPLVLDELHALGHSRLPVTKGDIDHIIGILHIRDLLSLDRKQSTTAEKAMDAKVYFINENDSLEFALKTFLKTRHHLFVVVNKNRETVGLLSLEDVIEALIGRSIMDEDDVHEDLQKLAQEKGAENNNTPHGVTL